MMTVLERGARLGGPQGILGGRLFGHLFALSIQKQIFPDLHMIRVKPIAVFNKMVSSKMGFLEEGSGNAFSHYRSKSNFAEPHVIHFKPISVSNKTVSSKRGSLGGGPWDAFLSLSFQ